MARQRHLKTACETLKLTTVPFHPWVVEMYVDDRLHYVYDLVPKVACTTWKSVLLELVARTRNLTLPGKMADIVTDLRVTDGILPRLVLFTDDERRRRLRDPNYFKFTFVREPLERLVSAYADKFGLRVNRYYAKVYGRQILRRYRGANATDEELETGMGVRFDEFVRYLLETIATTPSNLLDTHWMPQHILVQPCAVGYDVVGKFETLHEDAAEVLHAIDGDKFVRFPASSSEAVAATADGDDRRRRLRNGNRTESKVRTAAMLATVPRDSVEKLRQLYAVDYQLFNYPDPLL